MKEYSTYTPTATDVRWAWESLQRLEDGALWQVPLTSTVYRVDKSRKRLIYFSGHPFPTNDRVEATCAALGWAVESTVDREIVSRLPEIVWEKQPCFQSALRSWTADIQIGGNCWQLFLLLTSAHKFAWVKNRTDRFPLPVHIVSLCCEALVKGGFV